MLKNEDILEEFKKSLTATTKSISKNNEVEINASGGRLMMIIMLRVRHILGDEENTLKADSKWPWLTPRLVVSL